MRRMAIARALLCRPRLLIADEPTSDLDMQTAAEIMALLLHINTCGAALLVVTHDLELSRSARKIFTMNNGSLAQN